MNPSHRTRLHSLAAARLGEVFVEGDRRRVRFERRLDAAVEEVWAAITEPEQLRGWLAETPVFEPEPGGAVVIAFDDDVCEATVRAIEPPRLLELDWRFPGEEPSLLRFELWEVDGTTLLVLDHLGLTADHISSYGAGWHAHLDHLVAYLDAEDFAWRDCYHGVLPAYEEHVADVEA